MVSWRKKERYRFGGNYRTHPACHQEVLAATGGIGVNRVIETGGTDTFELSVKSTAFGGEIALVSSIGSINNISQTDLNNILTLLFIGLIKVRPIFAGSRVSFETMNRAIEETKLKPVIDKLFSFDELQNAYRYFSKGEHMGESSNYC